jgi:hypothetical protein
LLSGQTYYSPRSMEARTNIPVPFVGRSGPRSILRPATVLFRIIPVSDRIKIKITLLALLFAQNFK